MDKRYHKFLVTFSWQCRRRHYVFGLSVRPLRSSGQFLLPRYLINCLSNLDEIYHEYLIALTGDLIRFWRSEVKVATGRRGCKDIHDDAGVSKSHLLVIPVLSVPVTNLTTISLRVCYLFPAQNWVFCVVDMCRGYWAPKSAWLSSPAQRCRVTSLKIDSPIFCRVCFRDRDFMHSINTE